MSQNDEGKTESTPPLAPKEPVAEEMGVGITAKRTLLDDDSFEESATFNAEPQPETPVVAETPPEPAVPDSETEGQLDIPDNEEEKTQEHVTFDMEKRTLFLNPDRPIFMHHEPTAKPQVILNLAPTTTDDMDSYPEIAEEATDEDLPWLLSLAASEFPGTGSNTLIGATTRKGSHWTNMIERNGLPMLGDRRDKFKAFTDQGQIVAGNDAVEMFIAGTNLGRPVIVPLWHSGFWIKMRAPSTAYLAEIDRALAFSREELGLDVFGAIGSNDRLIFDEILVDAALKLVSKSSMPFSKNPLELKEYMSSFDIDSLIWAMAQAAYPDGCDIGIPCPSCRNVSNVQANLLRMRFVDESRLTANQLKHMAKGFSMKATPADLQEYRDEFEIINTDSWSYNNNKFFFRIPSVEEYLLSGRNYLSSIGRALTETLREEYTDDNKRAKAMKSMLDAEEACRFTHYVKEVHIRMPNDTGDGYGVAKDESAITGILRSISGDYDGTSDFIEAVRGYIVDALNTIVGFPNVKCPKCDKYHLNTLGEETLVVPFNPAIGFFTLAQHKISASGTTPLTDLTTLGVRDLLSRALVNGVPV